MHNLISQNILIFISREGAVILPYKRPRYTPPIDPAPPAQPAAKRPRVDPAPAAGLSPSPSTKYSIDVGSNLFKLIAKNFHGDSKILLSMAYSSSTWRSYESAWNCYSSFELESNLNSEWPITQSSLTNFITWCMYTRKLMSSSVQSYVNSLSSIHQLLGQDSTIFSSLITKAILRGTENLETSKVQYKHTRKVFTLPLLKLLGHEIARASWPDDSKRVFWSCACVSFFGSFRIGELLAASKSTFDPSVTLLWGDVKLKEDSCMIHVKIPKSKKKEGEFVDLFNFPDSSVCPVKGLISLKSSSLYKDDQKPVFLFANGTLLTPSVFNDTIRSLLKAHIGNEARNFSSHSLRAAIPSALAKKPELQNSADIKGWGRWDSDCYTRYTRLHLERKKAIFGKICDLFSNQACRSP